MSLPVVVPEEVARAISEIDHWWRANRSAAPSLFAEELGSAFEMIGAAPQMGRKYPHPRVGSLRRIMLRATRYHLYYRFSTDQIVVLAVWSAVRGSGPTLR